MGLGVLGPSICIYFRIEEAAGFEEMCYVRNWWWWNGGGESEMRTKEREKKLQETDVTEKYSRFYQKQLHFPD